MPEESAERRLVQVAWNGLRYGSVARLAAANFVVQGLAFLGGVVAARVLGVEGRGELAAVVLWPMLLANIGTLGVDWALAVQAGREPAAEGRLTRLCGWYGLLGGPVVMLAGLILVQFALPLDRMDLISLARMFLWIIPFYFVWMGATNIDNGLQRYSRYNLTRVSFFAIYLGAYLACWALGADQIRYFVYAQLGAMVLAVLVRVAAARTALLRDRLRREDVLTTLRLARPFAISTAVSMLLVRIDVILVMFLLGTWELGLYVVAQAVANVPSLLSQAFGVRTFGTSAGQGEAEFARVVVTRFRQSFLLSGALAIVMAILAPWLIVMLFGERFAEAAPAARVLFFASWLFNGGRIIDEGFRGQGQPIYGTIVFAGFIACVCVLAPLLVGPAGLGMMGVAWAVLAAAALSLALLGSTFRARTGRWL
jgi:O-antigen/teichoic acid export membrane protein